MRIADAAKNAARQLRADTAYSIIAVATMTLGMAAAAAIFSVVRGVMLRPLPYPDADALVAVQEFQPAMQRDQTTVSAADYGELRASARAFDGLTAFTNSEFVLSDGSDAERVIGALGDENLFPVLGVRLRLGRAFERAEVGQMPARVVVLSSPLWRRRYGSDPRIVGRSIVIDGDPYTVIGVTPDGFEFPRNASMNRDIDLWVPRRTSGMMMMRRAMRPLTVIGRLRAGIGISRAQAELQAVADRLAASNAATNAGWSIRAVPLRDVIVGRVRPALRMLFVCVAALLLVACINVSTAALARIVKRRQSLGVRLALGASHPALVELLLGESVFLALLAGVIATPLSVAVRVRMMQLAPVSIPRQSGVHLDGATLGFTLLLVVFVGVVTGTAPVLWFRRLDVRSLLGEGGGSLGSLKTRRALAVLMTAQLAVGCVLFGVTARLYATYAELDRIDPGFVADGVTTATLALSDAKYQSPRARSTMTTQLLGRVRALPGVKRAAVGSLLPMSGGIMSSGYQVLGIAADSTASAALRAVSGDFFETLGIPLREGREISGIDDASAPLVAVINQALARESFGGRPPVGAALRIAAPGRDSAEIFRVVGVVGDAKEKDLRSPASPIVYLSDRQASFPHTVLLVRSTGAAPMRAIRAAIHELDPSLALDDVGSLSAKVRETYALQIFLLSVLIVFAVSSASLIMVGVYGTVSYVVSAEMRAIGLRMALGATSARVLRLVLARTMRLATFGSAAGVFMLLLAPSVTATFASSGGGSWRDAAAATVAVVSIAVLASVIPALKASRLDPAAVLRE